MRTFGRWLLGSPIRILELVAAVVLLLVATLADTFGSAVFFCSLGALLLFLMLYSYLNQGRPGQ